MKKDSVEREMEAVDSEFQNFKSDDQSRKYQILQGILSHNRIVLILMQSSSGNVLSKLFSAGRSRNVSPKYNIATRPDCFKSAPVKNQAQLACSKNEPPPTILEFQ